MIVTSIFFPDSVPYITTEVFHLFVISYSFNVCQNIITEVQKVQY